MMSDRIMESLDATSLCSEPNEQASEGDLRERESGWCGCRSVQLGDNNTAND